MAYPPSTIGFIGGSGRMGHLFQTLFEQDGYTVLIAGRRTELTYEGLARQADVVIVTVPIAATAAVVERLAPVLDASQLLSDLTSVKAAPVASMLATPASVIGCHPVFGPVPDPAGQNVVLCPARPGPFLDWYADWFRGHGMRVELMTTQAHDEAMGVIQGLTHFLHLAYGHTLRRGGASVADLLRVSSPVHRILFALTARVLSGDPDLYRGIQKENPASTRWVSAFLDAAGELQGMLSNGPAETAETATAETAAGDDFAAVYRQAADYLGAALGTGQAESERLVAALADLVEPAEPAERAGRAAQAEAQPGSD